MKYRFGQFHAIVLILVAVFGFSYVSAYFFDFAAMKRRSLLRRLFSFSKFVTQSYNTRNLFAIDVTTKEMTEVSIKLVGNAFSYEDPHSWSRAVNNPPGTFANYLTSQVSNFVDFGSIGIADGNGSLRGVLLFEHYNEPHGADHIDENTLTPIMAILRACDDLFMKSMKEKYPAVNLSPESVCYVAFIAVDKSCRNKGIAGMLLKKANEFLTKKNFKYAFAYCSSPTSTRAFRREGYEVLGHITYADFEFNGTKPFGILQDEVSVVVKLL